MANRSDRGWGQPDLCPGRKSPQSRMGPYPRIPSRPAVQDTASTGRTQDCTRPKRHTNKILAIREPSTQDIKGSKADVASLFPLFAQQRTSQQQLNLVHAVPLGGPPKVLSSSICCSMSSSSTLIAVSISSRGTPSSNITPSKLAAP